jgi:hypothetical protein
LAGSGRTVARPYPQRRARRRRSSPVLALPHDERRRALDGRAAADLDFELSVLHDACADGDPEVHRVLIEKVFPRQAAVLDVAAWSAQVGGPLG